MTCFPTTATKAVNFPHTVENICILLSWLRSSLFCAEEASASTKRTLSPLFILKVCIFIGETLLFLNWAITADILMVSAANLFLRRASVEIPPVCQSAAVQFRREVSESSLKYSGCCGAAANRRSFSPNVDSRAGGRRGDVSLTSVQVSQTFHNEDVARAKSNETLCEAAGGCRRSLGLRGTAHCSGRSRCSAELSQGLREPCGTQRMTPSAQTGQKYSHFVLK